MSAAPTINPDLHVIADGDRVLCKYVGYRGKPHNPWFMGTIVTCNNTAHTCTVKYEDGDVSDGIVASELYFCPDGPFDMTIGKTLSSNDINVVVQSNTVGSPQPVQFGVPAPSSVYGETKDGDVRGTAGSLLHLAQPRDRVLVKYLGYRGRKDDPWFMGTIAQVDPANHCCSVVYEDGDTAEGVLSTEIHFAPDGPFNLTIGKAVRFNLIEDVVLSGKVGEVQSITFDPAKAELPGSGKQVDRSAYPKDGEVWVLSSGDRVLTKSVPKRGQSDNPWFAGNIKFIRSDCTSADVCCEDGDIEHGVYLSEIRYAPECPMNYTMGQTKHGLRMNDIDALVATQKIGPVFECSFGVCYTLASELTTLMTTSEKIPLDTLKRIPRPPQNAAIIHGAAFEVTPSAELEQATNGSAAFSVSGWCKPAGDGNGGTLMSRFTPNTAHFTVSVQKGKLTFARQGASSFDDISGKIQMGKWNHFCGTYDGNGRIGLILNGVVAGVWRFEEFTAGTPSSGPSPNCSNVALMIGGQHTNEKFGASNVKGGDHGAFFQGQVADLQIYTALLAETDCAVLMGGGTTQLCWHRSLEFVSLHLKAWYKCVGIPGIATHLKCGVKPGDQDAFPCKAFDALLWAPGSTKEGDAVVGAGEIFYMGEYCVGWWLL